MRYLAVVVALIFIVISSAWIASAFVDVPFVPEPEPIAAVDPSIREQLDARFQTRDIAVITGGALFTILMLFLANRSLAGSGTGSTARGMAGTEGSRAQSAGRENIAPPILPGPRLSIQEKIQLLRERHKEHNDLDTASMRAIALQRELLEESNLPYLEAEEGDATPARGSET